MYKKVLNVILVILIIAVIIAGGYLIYSYYSATKIKQDAEDFIDNEFDKLIVDVREGQEENPENNGNNNNGGQGYNGGSSSNNSVPLKYKGFAVAGKIEIPKTGIRYPILEENNQARALEVSVVKVYGPKVNTPGNVVIAGHNNNNRLFFGQNKKLQIGDKIYITDMNGKKLEYTIYNKYYTPGDDFSYVSKETNGATEITLYTCDATGKNRLIICARAE